MAQRDALLRLQRATFVILPLALFTLLAVALLPESRRVQGVAELWRADPALAAQSILGGMRDAPWVPLDGPDAVSRFEQEALGVSLGETSFAVDVRDAVREVFLTRSRLLPVTAVAVADAIVEEADRAGYDPFLVLAIIEVESNFDPKALSYRGARGLMQLMPDTRAWMVQRDGLANDSDDVHDIRIGVRYLSLLHKGFGGRLERALQAYNCGPGKLLEVMHAESPMPEETRAYPGRVMKRFQKLKRDYAYLGSKVLTKQV